MKKNTEVYPLTPLHCWFEDILGCAFGQLNMRVLGCNAYLYVRSKKTLCVALMYGRIDNIWKEIAVRKIFVKTDIPNEIMDVVITQKDNNITAEFRKVLLSYKRGYEEMGKGTNKAFQTALNIAANSESIMDVLKYKKDPNNKMDGFTRAGAMARAALNQDWFDFAKLSFEAVVDMISDDPLTYEEFLTAISQYTDAKIMQFSSEEQLRFVGGECFLNVVEEEQYVATKIQLYFKDEKNAWIKKEFSGRTDFDEFYDEALNGEISSILQAGGIKFPITNPLK